jgi:hypothetical protein
MIRASKLNVNEHIIENSGHVLVRCFSFGHLGHKYDALMSRSLLLYETSAVWKHCSQPA